MTKQKLLIILILIPSLFIGFDFNTSFYNVKDFGALGNGKTLDSPAINKAIEEAAAKGGGTIFFPAGTYLSTSIRLKSNISLFLDQGSIILAADPKDGFKYDLPEENKWDEYQDFGHTYFHNSLIWGENLENVSILGSGLINGDGLVRGGSQSRSREEQEALRDKAPKGREIGPFGYPNARDNVEPGWGNKAIALKLCRNIIFKDFTILHGGHFAILATAADNLTINNLKIDTDRDGIDIDCCKNVRVSDCFVNSPFDDGICIKSSFPLGYARATENVTITNCQVSGYDEGTLYDGTFKREYNNNNHFSPTGRIKFGTESNGGFKNITISNCVFEYCRGLALETVDGGLLEDVTIDNITMRDIENSPIFIRLGRRMRGPNGVSIGELRRVIISNVIVYNAAQRSSVLIVGLPEKDIEDITLDNIKIYYRGGGTKEQASIIPPENETDYPEPDRFGDTPSYGFFIRHVKNLIMNNIEVKYMSKDMRSPFVIDDIKGAEFNFIDAQKEQGVPTFDFKNVEDIDIYKVKNLNDKYISNSTQDSY
jgi:polygalacturonase